MAEARQYLLARGAVALDGPLHLQLFVAGHYDQLVEPPVAARLNQDGRLHYGDAARILGRHPRQPFLFQPLDRRMDKAVQQRQPLGLFEGLRRQSAPVDLPIRAQHAGAEFTHHRSVGFAARQQDFVPQSIGLQQMAAQLRQSLTHEALAACQPSREPHSQHNPNNTGELGRSGGAKAPRGLKPALHPVSASVQWRSTCCPTAGHAASLHSGTTAPRGAGSGNSGEAHTGTA